MAITVMELPDLSRLIVAAPAAAQVAPTKNLPKALKSPCSAQALDWRFMKSTKDGVKAKSDCTSLERVCRE